MMDERDLEENASYFVINEHMLLVSNAMSLWGNIQTLRILNQKKALQLIDQPQTGTLPFDCCRKRHFLHSTVVQDPTCLQTDSWLLLSFMETLPILNSSTVISALC